LREVLEGIRTLDLNRAMDKMVEEKGKNAFFYVYDVWISPYCLNTSVHELRPICTRVMKQEKATQYFTNAQLTI
jgi:hypothetical protein